MGTTARSYKGNQSMKKEQCKSTGVDMRFVEADSAKTYEMKLMSRPVEACRESVEACRGLSRGVSSRVEAEPRHIRILP